ncbi:galactoside 2-alpha-L-fucosyltransferase 2-like [Centruroides sculpturatus]|uniref:galactoside 2-alpha-L-fucosyltransferase 2-like n=1 Tax=Centruroides sculpturatus TaxID=218467 RepID=UPI000C6EF3CD|nr:galactoside 2-alpha-L-fucosyltransferase 2-like [Centruroides sculpturatus]
MFRRSSIKYLASKILRRGYTFFIVILIVICIISVPKYQNYRETLRINEEVLRDPSFITIQYTLGRLGNQMGTYAALFGLADLNNRTPYGFHYVMNYLRPYFRVTAGEIYNVPSYMKREYALRTYLYPEDKHIPADRNFLGGYQYPYSYTFFHHARHKILKEFQFHDHITSYAFSILKSYKEKRPTALLIGVHVRRSDYCSWLRHYNGREVDLKYFEKAMLYFKRKYHDVIFVVVSDDRTWCRKNLGHLPDVAIPPEPEKPIYDMATLALCNHTIMTYGTFGFWSAYLAGGETVYFADYLAPNSSFLLHHMPYNKTYLPNWIGISTTKPDYWNTFNFDTKTKFCP